MSCFAGGVAGWVVQSGVELEQKASILHEDITKHWLVREIALLQNLIDRANEKGWRREYPLDDVSMLFISNGSVVASESVLSPFKGMQTKGKTPSEQSRLLLEIPKVIAEELEPKATPQDPLGDEKHGNSCSPKPIIKGASEIPAYDSEVNLTLSTQNSGSTDAAGLKDAFVPSLVVFSDSSVGREGKRDINGVPFSQQPGENAMYLILDSQCSLIFDKFDAGDQSAGFSPATMIRNGSSGGMQVGNWEENNRSQGMAEKQLTATQVVELSDDENEAEGPGGQNQIVDCHPESLIWYYADPQGDKQGPFSMSSIKRWSDANYFHPGFKVWKTELVDCNYQKSVKKRKNWKRTNQREVVPPGVVRHVSSLFACADQTVYM
ncbi:unnamed protein product [Ilex paraguariensis]|uniref:GYF domain-containing protein n=1 Tax=Ilex paraguariensis TaxID=185542 RepID=A0ABC8SJX6_9AQUA